MDKKGFWILLMVAGIAALLLWSAGGDRIKDEAPYYLKKIIKETATVEVNEKNFLVEVARKPEARTKGLLGREYLAPDKGMIFVYEQPGIYSFTMQGMEMTLDIIWINDGKIVYIERSAKPGQQTINPKQEALYVLEIRATASTGWNIGDEVSITFDK